MTMRERIASGRLFTDYCEGLPEDRHRCKKYMKEFNDSSVDDMPGRLAAMEKLFGRQVKGWIEPPFYCCYGTNIFIGDFCYINFNCNFVDDGKITIGQRVMFGPAVTIATVGHPLDPEFRKYMYANPVTIGNDCWIGAGVTICPGVTIGDNCTIGAGSVVIRDVPANSIAVGNPCRLLRELNDDDKKYYCHGRPISEEDLKELHCLEEQGK